MSKSIYILAPYPRGEAPSQRFRFEQYIKMLEEKEYVIHFHPFINLKTWKTLYSQGKTGQKIGGMLRSIGRRWKLLLQLKKADYIFIHREVAQLGPPIFEWIIAKILRKKYIYDFDDATWLPNYSENNAKFHRLKAYWKVKYCIKWANKVTAGNAYLAKYAKQFNTNVEIIPTTIDTDNYHNKTIDYSKPEIIIGWTGSHTTMRYLTDLVPVIRALEQKYTFTFTIISNFEPEFNLKSLQFIRWSKTTEIDDLARFSIGVMPLQPDIWSYGKCGFKGLQYMSLGIPSVMSPVGVNNQIIVDGENGFLAEKPIEWQIILEKLIQDASLRKKIGLKGQETVKKQYSVSSQSKNYLNLFSAD